MPKRVLLIGGPSTGKTTLINYLSDQGYVCLEEISRQVTKDSQAQGIDQLFLEKPLLFSELLRDARIEQHKEADLYTNDFVFIDRGIPDTVAYMEYISQEYPSTFEDACKEYRYDVVFILPLWEKIHETDSERYETFTEARKIQDHLIETYRKYNYDPIEVPTGPIPSRADYILKKLDY